MYNPSKSNCMLVTKNGKCPFLSRPTFSINNDIVSWTENITVLGCIYSQDGDYKDHVKNRVNKCRQAYHSLMPRGLAYPGLSNTCKSYLYTTSVQPVLLYGATALGISKKGYEQLDKMQGGLIKKCMGLPQRCHHTNLVEALNVRKCSDVILKGKCSLFYRTMCIDSPAKDVCDFLISRYFKSNLLVEGSILHSVISNGVSPIRAAVRKISYKDLGILYVNGQNGVLDSLRHVISKNNFNKNDHDLIFNLVRCF